MEEKPLDQEGKAELWNKLPKIAILELSLLLELFSGIEFTDR